MKAAESRIGAPSFASPEDRSLADELEAGGPEAVETVRSWIRLASRPYRFALGADLEDLEQDVLLSVTETLRRGGFEGRSTLATYVKRAVVYRCLNRVRDGRKRTFVAPEDVRLESEGPGPYGDAARRDELERALRVVSEMSEDCRRLWRWLHRGMSYPEMSERLGVAAGTLRVRMLRCRRAAHEAWKRLTGEARSGDEAPRR